MLLACLAISKKQPTLEIKFVHLHLGVRLKQSNSYTLYTLPLKVSPPPPWFPLQKLTSSSLPPAMTSSNTTFPQLSLGPRGISNVETLPQLSNLHGNLVSTHNASEQARLHRQKTHMWVVMSFHTRWTLEWSETYPCTPVVKKVFWDSCWVLEKWNQATDCGLCTVDLHSSKSLL